MNSDHVESMRKTAGHIRRVQDFLLLITSNLTDRGIKHDASKWSPEEWPYFAEATARLQGLTYGSEEYRRNLETIRPAIDHHQGNNRHHPEYWDRDVTRMSLLDLMEMLADWRAATERHDDGDIMKSLEINAKRFGIPGPIRRILENTIREMGWDGPRAEVGG